MKLTIFTQYYPPEIGAPQNRLSNLASHFVAAEHQVTVLTAMPNYPTGRVKEGYGGAVQRECRDGVSIVRTFIYPCQSAALIPRLLSYFSFVFSSVLFGSLLVGTSDYLLVESPPLFLGLSAVWLSWLKGAKLIFNVSDLWPQSAVSLGVIRPNSFSHQLALRLESFCYKKSWLVTGQSRSILRDIKNRFPGQSTFLLSNGADTGRFGPEKKTIEGRTRLTSKDEFVVLYAGLHGLAQGLEQIIDAAAELRHDENFRFALMGDGPQKQQLIQRARRLQLQNVTFLDPVSADHMPEILAAADLIVVPLGMDIPGAVPSKLYEAMATGRAIVLVANGEAAEIVHQYEAGLVVAPGDIHSLALAFQKVREDAHLTGRLGEHARTAAVRHFDRRSIAVPFIRYLESRTNCERHQAESVEVNAGL